MKKSNAARLACLVLALTLSDGALAETKGPEPSPATPSKSSSSKPAPSQVGARAEAEAHKAKQRSDEAAKEGKPSVAARLSSLAATWSKVAAHERRAAELEAEAKETEKKVLKLRGQAKKAVSLLDQTEARRSRALARLMELGLSDASPPAKANEADATPSEAQK